MDTRKFASFFTQRPYFRSTLGADEAVGPPGLSSLEFAGGFRELQGSNERRNTDETPFADRVGRGSARDRRARFHIARAGVEARQPRLAGAVREQRRCGQRDQSFAHAEAEQAPHAGQVRSGAREGYGWHRDRDRRASGTARSAGP